MKGTIMKTRKSQTKTDNRECHCMGKCEVCACRQHKKSGRKEYSASFRTVFALVAILLVSTGLVVGQSEQTGSSSGKPGLLIIAHGSPSPQWNKPVLALEEKVCKILKPDNPFAKVKVVFMEFTEPNVADGIKELEKADCDRIVTVPLLVAPSSHSHWDIPALLGIYSNPEIEKMLLEEGAQPLRSKLPITLTTTLSDSDVIEKVMLKRVRQLSSDPKKEAIVLLAHGSAAIPPSWERLMKRTVTYICGQTGISYGDWATVGVGQEYNQAATAIQEAAKHRDNVIVVGAYLSLGVNRMHQRWSARFDQESPMPGLENPLDGLSIRMSSQGLLPDEAVAQWIAATARDEIKRHP
jgi:sirohydrochlorin ferrochelatase